MKLEVGKAYKTESGEKVYIIGERKDDTTARMVGHPHDGPLKHWYNNGSVSHRMPPMWRIVEEWKEPRVQVRWVVMDSDLFIRIFVSEEAARAEPDVIAITKVTLTEGQFND